MTPLDREGPHAAEIDLEDDDLRDLNLALGREEVYAEVIAVQTPDALERMRSTADRVLGRVEAPEGYIVKTFPGPRDADCRWADLHEIKLAAYYEHRNEVCRDRYADETKAQGRTVRTYTNLRDMAPEERAAHRRAQKAASKARSKAASSSSHHD